MESYRFDWVCSCIWLLVVSGSDDFGYLEKTISGKSKYRPHYRTLWNFAPWNTAFGQTNTNSGKQHQPFKALNGVSLNIGTGMFGLLGPNGAGKSTMMRTICGILEQSYGKSGSMESILREKREELQGLIGYLPGIRTYENMPAQDFLGLSGYTERIDRQNERAQRIEYVLKAVHMWEKRGDKIGSYSGGMKQRIGIAQILLQSYPKFWLLTNQPPDLTHVNASVSGICWLN